MTKQNLSVRGSSGGEGERERERESERERERGIKFTCVPPAVSVSLYNYARREIHVLSKRDARMPP